MKAYKQLLIKNLLFRPSQQAAPIQSLFNCQRNMFSSVVYKQPSKQTIEQKSKQETLTEQEKDRDILRLIMKQEKHRKMFEKYSKTHFFDIKSMKELQEKVIENQYPVIVVYYQTGCKDSEKLINTMKKYIGKSGGKFSLATIDIKNNNEITGNSLQAFDTPTTYLMYKASSTLEVKGYPSKSQMKELLKSSIFLYQITNEENLINSLIRESKQCIRSQQFEDALFLLNEAKMMDKWKNLYGSTIMANLAFVQAKRGNFVLARQYLNEYYQVYGINTYDQHENDNLQYVKYILEQQDNLKLKESGISDGQSDELISKASIESASSLYEKNNFEKAVKVSMELLRQNYENSEAHELLMKIFNELGSDNNLVIDTRLDIKDMLLKQSRHF